MKARSVHGSRLREALGSVDGGGCRTLCALAAQTGEVDRWVPAKSRFLVLLDGEAKGKRFLPEKLEFVAHAKKKKGKPAWQARSVAAPRLA